jgi:hypothetical protein
MFVKRKMELVNSMLNGRIGLQNITPGNLKSIYNVKSYWINFSIKLKKIRTLMNVNYELFVNILIDSLYKRQKVDVVSQNEQHKVNVKLTSMPMTVMQMNNTEYSLSSNLNELTGGDFPAKIINDKLKLIIFLVFH